MYIFIINPAAGYGRANKVYDKLKRTKAYRDIKSQSFFTEYLGHAEEIAQSIAKRKHTPRCVIVIGGDGTLHEVINGLSGSSVSVAFIPGGSGNDFARGISLKGHAVDIFERILQEHRTIEYWCGDYTIEGTTRQFVNSIGFGFDAEITRQANQSVYKKWLSIFYLSSLSYVFALIYMIFYFKPMTVTLKLDGQLHKIESCWMITIANQPYYGGGMKIIPHATVQPDVFSLLVIRSISKWKILALFMTVFAGKHLTFKEVECFDASDIEIHSSRPICYQVDGQTGVCQHAKIRKNSDYVRVASDIQ
ncbi:diacylglycerol/lipid kinase family protein [Lentibacillus saliphilus]|uniref:diacylglycerol/lipid kinase family protein n=1 Tax=Lentibacillus saliphilus TaxID=2737028 RepID=UPI001C2F57D6|nr:diacylglycerol kinase family protein [Lentibacillus saliphilus]